jgi:DNA-binding NarL/FixJ family response regulator
MTTTELPPPTRADSHAPLMIAVVSSSPLVRTGLAQVLGEEETMTVVCVVDSIAAVQHRDQRPDLVIIDLYGQRGNGFGPSFWGLLPPGSAAIVLCRPDDPPDLRAALSGGARAILTREADVPELIRAVRIVREGGLHVTAELVPHLLAQTAAAGSDRRQSLANREVETLQWVAEGLTHGQISRRMGLTEATVSTYVKRIRTKLNAGNKAELTRRAIELGYFTPR